MPIPNLFTYRIPFDLNEAVSIGCRVVVPFGRRKIITGIVAKIHEKPPLKVEAKYILELLDHEPAINPKQLELMEWMANYYMCTKGEVLSVALPSGLKLSSESLIQKNPDFEIEENLQMLSDRELTILRNLSGNDALTYDQVKQFLALDNVYGLVKSLIQKEAVIIYEQVKERYTPKTEKRLRLTADYVDEKALEQIVNKLESRPKQQQIILKYLQQVPVLENSAANSAGMAKADIANAGLSVSSLKTLIKNGALEEFAVNVSRIQDRGEATSEITLTDEQRRTCEEILLQFEHHNAALLHGITGSGKTEVYIELINEVIANGNQALYLLPEIALTTQIVSRLRKIFGDQMGVYHSKFSDSERVEIWKGLQEGRFSFVVGVRSAVFLPFDNLALIIVDEEHDYSYKQHDPAPRYHARDVAQVMAGIHHAKVLLGSATPSAETYYLAQSHKFGLVNLEQRYGDATLPAIEMADTLKARKKKTMRGEFAESLLEALQETIAKKEQAIIFQNRRGYAPYITCQQCAWVPKCENCSVSLTYHLYKNELRCHYCGYKEKVPVNCAACGSEEIQTVSYGTEKLEEELQLLLPEANIQRMDLDTTRKKLSYQRIINDFEEGATDILVGTQMVTKGLDFDNVTLVGILDIDRMMHFPDFRSHERTFQLATQVSGRAGRRNKAGRVIIQSNNSDHPFFGLIANQDYKSFYNLEINERKKFRYPPFVRLVRLVIKHAEKDTCQSAAYKLSKRLTANLGSTRVIGPQEPVISKIRNQFLMEIYIKLERDKTNLPKAKALIAEEARSLLSNKQLRNTRIIFDVDPY